MFRLSKLTDYAIVILTQLPETSDDARSASAIAERIGVAETTVAKVLKSLAKAGVVRSKRGVAGGYHLDRRAENIPVLAVIEALDGPVAITECTDTSTAVCTAESLCPLRGNWNRVNEAIRTALTDVSVADMIALPEAMTAPLKG